MQGLVTNDIRHLDERLEGVRDLSLHQEQVAASVNAVNAIYAMFLNIQGRVLFDVLVFEDQADPDRFVLECHMDVVDKLAKHLKIRLRRKVSIEPILGAQRVVVMPQDSCPETDSTRIAFPTGAVFSVDPRLPELGHRFVIPAGVSLKEVFGTMEKKSELNFEEARYRLGVSEGPKEMPPGKCFPLEYVQCRLYPRS